MFIFIWMFTKKRKKRVGKKSLPEAKNKRHIDIDTKYKWTTSGLAKLQPFSLFLLPVERKCVRVYTHRKKYSKLIIIIVQCTYNWTKLYQLKIKSSVKNPHGLKYGCKQTCKSSAWNYATHMTKKKRKKMWTCTCVYYVYDDDNGAP